MGLGSRLELPPGELPVSGAFGLGVVHGPKTDPVVAGVCADPARILSAPVGQGIGLWDEADEFFYDVLHTPDIGYLPLRVRSLVGLMPLLAVETIELREE